MIYNTECWICNSVGTISYVCHALKWSHSNEVHSACNSKTVQIALDTRRDAPALSQHTHTHTNIVVWKKGQNQLYHNKCRGIRNLFRAFPLKLFFEWNQIPFGLSRITTLSLKLFILSSRIRWNQIFIEIQRHSLEQLIICEAETIFFFNYAKYYWFRFIII